MNDPLDYSGKVALITGAAAGMRLATTQAFAQAGAAVVLADFKEDAVKTATRSGLIRNRIQPSLAPPRNLVQICRLI